MVSCLMGDSTALASAIVRCCPNKAKGDGSSRPFFYAPISRSPGCLRLVEEVLLAAVHLQGLGLHPKDPGGYAARKDLVRRALGR